MPPAPDFYIGYDERMSAGLARVIRRVVAVLLGAAVGVAGIFATGFRPLPASLFEFGHVRTFEGALREFPYPMLLVRGVGNPPLGRTPYLLVAPGKHGAGDLVRGLDGRRVQLRGTLAERSRTGLIEIVPGSIDASGGPAAPDPGAVELGRRTLRGEIVDSKCFLGVMNPGERKVHRDCAIRCIAGGIPPALVVRDGRGQETLLLLTTPDGSPIGPAVASLAGLPVEVAGDVVARDQHLWVQAAASAYRRLGW